jgi:hypothetical protein
VGTAVQVKDRKLTEVGRRAVATADAVATNIELRLATEFDDQERELLRTLPRRYSDELEAVANEITTSSAEPRNGTQRGRSSGRKG